MHRGPYILIRNTATTAHNNTMAELHTQTHNTLARVPAQWQSSLLAAEGRKMGKRGQGWEGEREGRMNT